MEIKVTNVNRALSEGLHWLKVAGVRENSRNGPVLVSPEPVMTIYTHPWERVLFSPRRDANPFFHVMEALWMLAGRDDVAFPAQFAKQIREYSDDGKSLHGAYGRRWRTYFGYDQIEVIAAELRKNSESRRCVLTMWEANQLPARNSMEWESGHPSDLFKAMEGGKDVPCNTHIYIDAREKKLNMTVLCRSNDIWWGAYGANAVHFSFLQEYLAASVGLSMGVYRQFSNNFHLYTNLVPEGDLHSLATDSERNDRYSHTDIQRVPLVSNLERFNFELPQFVLDPYSHSWHEPFIQLVALPMFEAWRTRKTAHGTGLVECSRILADDWRLACTEWIERREEKRAKARTETSA